MFTPVPRGGRDEPGDDKTVEIFEDLSIVVMYGETGQKHG